MMSAGLGVSAATFLRLCVSRFASTPMLRSGCARPLRPFSSSLARCAALEPPDVPHLADTARISLTAAEVEEFAPKISQVVDWFGQLQAVDLGSIEPSLRADTEEVSISQRDDEPETFENREAIITAVPRYDDPYLKVPRVLNKE